MRNEILDLDHVFSFVSDHCFGFPAMAFHR